MAQAIGIDLGTLFSCVAAVREGKAVILEGTDFEVRSPLTISSIGSLPEPIEGLPMKWNLLDIESEETGAVSVRSALELLSTAYALHPAFGEAEIVEFGAAVRPAFPDNLPRIVVNGRHIYVNGLFRHGFLLAPALAELVTEHVATGARHPEVFVEDRLER